MSDIKPMPYKRLLLGPQRPVINLADAVASAAIPKGPMAVISAGWQEAEGDIDDVYQLLQRPLVDLRLYHRAESLFDAEPKLRDAYRQRQERLKELQRLYRLRSKQLMMAARQILKAEGSEDLIETERRHAVMQVRTLDQHHLRRVQTIQAEYDQQFNPDTSEHLARHAMEIKKTLDESETILITGGNVPVLLNRLRLFGVERLLADKHLVAWSAGAMVLSDVVVLYHDKTPLGRRDPEVLCNGAGVIPGYVFLPDAKRRLRNNDKVRSGLLCRRFAPATCVTLDNGALLQFEGCDLQRTELAAQLTRSGSTRGL